MIFKIMKKIALIDFVNKFEILILYGLYNSITCSDTLRVMILIDRHISTKETFIWYDLINRYISVDSNKYIILV